MDDVWLVIALLLFGSLLFCLCCYKVTNLLYMLYHIDDVEIGELDDSPTVGGGSGSGVTAAAVASGDEIKDYRLLNNVASSTGLGCNHIMTPPPVFFAPRCIEPSKKSASVSSLSVGVQCDVMSLSEWAPDSRTSLLERGGSTPTIYERREHRRSGKRAPSSTSSLNRGPRQSEENDWSDSFQSNRYGSIRVAECSFIEERPFPCHRHHPPSRYRRSESPLRNSSSTANHHRSVPCQYSSIECVKSSSSSYSNPRTTYCSAHKNGHLPPRRSHRKSNSINNLNHPSSSSNNIIPPPLDFCAQSSSKLKNLRGDEEGEDDDDEVEENLLLLQEEDEERFSDDQRNGNPFINSPTSLC